MADLTSISKSGPAASRVDITFVAEGYTAAERDLFLAHAKSFGAAILGPGNAAMNAPFSNYASYFNVNALFVASNESRLNVVSGSVDTYFKASSYLSDGRLVYGDSFKVDTTVSAALPAGERDITIVLVNSKAYGGAGGAISWATTGNPSSVEILLHELGHSVAGLADSYPDASLAGSINEDFRAPNATGSKTSLPWQAWLGFEDALGTVGVFEGAAYRSTGAWRPTFDSKMFHLGQPFSAPEKEALALAFYARMGDYLSVQTLAPGLYAATLPDAKTVDLRWQKDGAPIAVANTGLLDLYASGLYAAGANIELTSIDKTGLIRTGLDATRQIEKMVTQGAVVDIAGKDVQLAAGLAPGILRFDGQANAITLAVGIKGSYIDGGDGADAVLLDAALMGLNLRQLSSGTWVVSQAGTPVLALRSVETLKLSTGALALSTQIDATAPALSAFGPQQETGGTLPDAALTVRFNEAVQAGSGSILLKRADGQLLASFDMASSKQVSLQGEQLVLKPEASLNLSTGYRLEFGADALRDLAGNAYADKPAFNFTTAASADLLGGAGNDMLVSRSGSDKVNGGLGFDTLRYSGKMADYDIVRQAGALTVADKTGLFGTDQATGIERLRFADAALALGADGIDGQAYRVYQAAFNRTPDSAGLGYWISVMDGGVSLREVADGFVASPEFQALYGVQPTKAQILDKFYQNVLHRPGDPAGFAYWLDILESGKETAAGVLAGFSESAENQSALLGVIGNGFSYIPYG